MTGIWRFSRTTLLALLVAACSVPSSQERLISSEIAKLTPLKQSYSGVVMGFDVQHGTTLVVSLDLQNYIAMDDDAVDAMKRDALQRWRLTWHGAHPHAHARVHVRFIDFIGRKVAEESTRV